MPGLTPRDASAALALVTAATELQYEVVGFFAGNGGFKKRGRQVSSWHGEGLTPLAISPRQRLDDAVKTVSGLPFGGTDCALPMLYAQARGREIDTFLIYTDSETWAGDVHPPQALCDYRNASGIDARLVVVGMVSNGFSIADPADLGMLRRRRLRHRDVAAHLRPNIQRERRREMHLHLVRVAARPKPLRPAKVIVLETRRKARLERARPERQPPRQAA